MTSVEVLFNITLEFPSKKNNGDCNFMKCVGERCTEQLKSSIKFFQPIYILLLHIYYLAS